MFSTSGSTPSYDFMSPSSSKSDNGTSDQTLFSLVYGDHEYITSISRRDLLTPLEHFKSAFLSAILDNSAEGKNPSGPLLPQSRESLVLLFIRYLLKRNVDLSIVSTLTSAFQKDFLKLADIHSVISSLPDSSDTQKDLLKTYYSAITQCSLPVSAHDSALFKYAQDGTIDLVTIFGGQGAFNPRCVQELRDIYNTYSPFLATLIDVVDSTLSELCHLSDTSDFYNGREISLKRWLNDSDDVLDSDFIATAAVSFPIIGTIGMAHFCVVCKVLGKTPGDIISSLKGMTGHSQGIVVAAGMARSDSWLSFYENARLVIKTLFWLGYESHLTAPRISLPSSIVDRCIQNGDGRPSPMLLVSGPDRKLVDVILNQANSHLSSGQYVHLALANTRDGFVLAGPARSLVHVTELLRGIRAEVGMDQSRLPFNQRKPKIETQFLPISAPFHTPYLKLAAERVKSRLSEDRFSSSELLTSVYHTRDGSDMSQGGVDFLDSLVDAVTTDQVDWPKTLGNTNSSHVLAFGKGVGEVVIRNKDGLGVQVIFASQLTPLKAGSGAKGHIFAPYLSDYFVNVQSWEDQFRPNLVKSESGAIRLENRLTRLLGVPPILVAGMTPTTVPWDFVSAVMDAGYYAELAGGGYYNADSMSKAITKLVQNIPAGRGITCNLIYVSPAAMAWQIAMLRQLVHKNYPIEGLTIGAGVPSPEVAADYINSLGLKYITFKPGSLESIQSVLDIAKAHPSFPVIIQWTGGRGGGHHSFEDFHQPILESYRRIRNHSNVYLVAGSGFGDGEGSYPYLVGSWSTKFGYAKMPFDGILLGSRLMVAKEAHTSLSVKNLICSAPGTTDSEWTKSYSEPVGGVVTVQSEMGQPIHKLANRAVLFWKEMDERIFSLPQTRQLEAIQKHKDYIISRLNADFAKPWFGRNKAGEAVEISQMTYLEILERLISLTYVSHQSRWIHASYSGLVFDVVIRTVERLQTPLEITRSEMSDPLGVLSTIRVVVPKAFSTIIHPEDVLWFLNRCKSRGQKPVNFVPILDENFSFWMKKDSLWQSEDIDTVPDRDPERVCILHGPVSAKYSKTANEPAKEILNGVNYSLIAHLARDTYVDSGEDIPTDSSFYDSPQVSHGPLHVREDGNIKVFQILPITPPPSEDEWFDFVASSLRGWMRSVFCSSEIIKKGARHPSYLRSFFASKLGRAIHVDEKRATITLQQEWGGSLQKLVEMRSLDGRFIDLKLFVHPQHKDSPVVLKLPMKFDSTNTICCLQELDAGRISRIQSFYSKLWLGSEPPNKYDIHSTFQGVRTTLTSHMLSEWLSCVGLSYSNESIVSSDSQNFPMNACIVPAWEALVAPLTTPQIDGDLLNLLHLSNEFKYVDNAKPLCVGDSIEVSSHVQSITIDDRGKAIAVCATIFRENRPIMHITSRFLIKGYFPTKSGTFQRDDNIEMVYKVASTIDEAVLRDRKWLDIFEDNLNLVGTDLIFRLNKFSAWGNEDDIIAELRISGSVFQQDQNQSLRIIGRVMFEASNCKGDPVSDFLDRKAKPRNSPKELEHPGLGGSPSMIVKMPSSGELYSRVSKDHNPIHVSPIFARFVNLQGPIVHGMYTSAVAGSTLDHLLDDLDHSRFRRFSVSFVGMVLPGDQLKVECSHTTMIDGRMIFKLKVTRVNDDNLVLEGEAELEQPKTAYLFTGQGSQRKGMGMELYKSSPVAKAIWDEVDEYFVKNYGWSILKVVRENPKELTIHFSGKRGREIRHRYLEMRTESLRSDGSTVSKCVLDGLTPTTRSYTFQESRGILFLTQFAQPAIVTLEKAAFADMRANGLVQDHAQFAGHSLGEYGALSALAEFMPFNRMIDVIFYRGLSMQTMLDRSENVNANYTMVAVDPGRVGKCFNETTLRLLTGLIASQSHQLLEIVNFNVQGEQYVCAGTVQNIHTLTQLLNELSGVANGQLQQWLHELEQQELGETRPLSNKQSHLHSMIIQSVKLSSKLPRPIELARGRATIPLLGIDVPFHSSYLRSGVAQYRRFLQERIRVEDIQTDILEGNFVPNVMGKPFSVDRQYLEEAMALTGSEVLRDLIQGVA